MKLTPLQTYAAWFKDSLKLSEARNTIERSIPHTHDVSASQHERDTEKKAERNLPPTGLEPTTLGLTELPRIVRRALPTKLPVRLMLTYASEYAYLSIIDTGDEKHPPGEQYWIVSLV